MLGGVSVQAQVEHQSYQWDNVTIVGGGFVSGILYHPAEKDLVYARTDIGGAYRWNPHNHHWIPLMDWIQRPDWNLYGVESIGLDPGDPKRLYLACGTYLGSFASNGAILRSTDQGRTFKRTDMPFKMGGNEDGRSIGERIAVDPNNGSHLLYGSRTDGLWRSGDYGATWNKVDGLSTEGVNNRIGVSFEVFDPSTGTKGKGSTTIYAAVASTRAGLVVSKDGGDTWQTVPGQPTGVYPHHGLMTPTGELVLTYSNGPGPNGVSNGAVWKFDTKQSLWIDITPVRPTASKGFGYAGLSNVPQQPNVLAVTTLDRWADGDDVFLTRDNGTAWTSLKSTAQMDSSGSPFLNWGQKAPKFGWWMGTVQIDPFQPSRILFGTGATIWGTDDATPVLSGKPTHWTVRAQGLEETAVIDLMSPPKGAHIYSALGDIGGFRHDNFKVAPREGMQSNPLFNNTDSVDFAELNPDVMVRVGRAGNGIRHGGFSTDGGKTWQPFESEPPANRGSGHVAISAEGRTIVWTPSRQRAYYSRDFGSTWTLCEGGPQELMVVADRVDPNLFFGFGHLGNEGSFYRSTNGGKSFEKVEVALPAGTAVLRTVPGMNGACWLAVSNHLFRFDGMKVGPEAPNALATTSLVSTFGFGKAAPGRNYPSIFLIGGVNGVEGAFRSDDEGKSWICITDAAHGFGTMDHIIGDPRIYGRVYIGMNGRGVLYGDPKH